MGGLLLPLNGKGLFTGGHRGDGSPLGHDLKAGALSALVLTLEFDLNRISAHIFSAGGVLDRVILGGDLFALLVLGGHLRLLHLAVVGVSGGRQRHALGRSGGIGGDLHGAYHTDGHYQRQ